ncbi:MAG: tetratricopeptide repeat protein [Armatimonadota bacterium]|jgi:tetratricopeptide (TPR) repeat protein
MKSLSTLVFVMVIIAGLWAGSCCEAADVKQMTTAGITVSYPAGMETQAKKVMEVAQSAIKPSLDTHRQTISLLSNVGALATDITQALGAEEKQDTAKSRLQMFKEKSEAMVGVFSNIKLVRKSDAVATDGIDAGLVQVRYSKDKDEFNMVFEDKNLDQDKIKRSYFPVLINPDGTIRSEDKLGQMAQDFLGAGEAMAIAPVQDTISYLIAVPLKLYNPFSRWFNEGVSGYLTRQMVAKYGSKQLNDLATSLFTVGPGAQELRGKVNLLSWPQAPYINKNPAVFDAKLEAAKVQYSIEAISGLLSKSGPQTLAKIMGQLNYTGNPDTDTICEAIKKVTNTDFKSVLLTYVPKNVADGIAANQAPTLIEKAEKLALEKKWDEAANALRLVLEMDPQNANARLNLAWVDRELGDRLDAEWQVFLMAGMLEREKHSFHLFDGTIEGNYVCGRLAILMGNLEAAKQFLTPVLELKPDHADAKKAMEEIRQIEDAAKGVK